MCLSNHSACAHSVSGSVINEEEEPIHPTRIIDISIDEGLQHPSLVEISNTSGYYTAVSHCWGIIREVAAADY